MDFDLGIFVFASIMSEKDTSEATLLIDEMGALTESFIFKILTVLLNIDWGYLLIVPRFVIAATK